jgi:cytochrome c-type biogenesis protein CcmH
MWPRVAPRPRRPHKAPVRSLLAIGVLAFALPSLATLARADEAAPGDRASAPVGGSPSAAEHTLASRLLAPCCWNQTLDVHTSELALSLRREIRTRLAGGETAEAIEADLVGRYGERILAVPQGSPLGRVAATVLALVGLAGLGLLLLGFRWRRRVRQAAEPAPAHPRREGPPDRWDERLEAELREM